MIARIRYRLPHARQLLESDWVTPTYGWDMERTVRAFRANNPTADVIDAVDITANYARRRHLISLP